MDDLTKLVAFYFLVGATITAAFYAYLSYYHPGPERPLDRPSPAAKVTVYVLMFVLMSALWVAVYPTLILVSANKRPARHDPEDDYR